MSTTSIDYDRKSAPESWTTTSYSVRRPGNAAWEDGIATLADARASRYEANRVCARGHVVYAHQECVGHLPGLQGEKRVIEVP